MLGVLYPDSQERWTPNFGQGVKLFPALQKRGTLGKVTRTRYGANFKAKVALEAIKGEQTVAELAAKYSIHPTMNTTWKKQAIEGMSSTFSNKLVKDAETNAAEVERLHAKIGQLIVERGAARASARPLG
jgi:transposase